MTDPYVTIVYFAIVLLIVIAFFAIGDRLLDSRTERHQERLAAWLMRRRIREYKITRPINQDFLADWYDAAIPPLAEPRPFPELVVADVIPFPNWGHSVKVGGTA